MSSQGICVYHILFCSERDLEMNFFRKLSKAGSPALWVAIVLLEPLKVLVINTDISSNGLHETVHF